MLEALEDRRLLNASPIARNDLAYYTPVDQPLVVDSTSSLLVNDFDPDGGTLSASVVANPQNGTLTDFDPTSGTFTYVPNAGFSGIDRFTYQLSDGQASSSVATVQIAVGGPFGGKLNDEEFSPAEADRSATGVLLASGALTREELLTPSVKLVYNSLTIPKALVPLETFLVPDAAVPDEIRARLVFNGVAGDEYSFDPGTLQPGGSLRIVLSADATALPTGRYPYTIELQARYGQELQARSYDGYVAVVNRSTSDWAFGRGWQLGGLDQLYPSADGVLWVRDSGDAYWFASDGAGGYLRAAGDLTFSQLSVDQAGNYVLRDRHGFERVFSSSGLLLAARDRYGNTTSFTWNGGLLTSITDPFGRTTSLGYTNGQLTSVTDFAGRQASLGYDASGHLVTITQPDPDGTQGPLLSPVISFTYGADDRLASRSDPIGRATQFGYGTHGRVVLVTHPDSASESYVAAITVGLPVGTQNNTLASTDPWSTRTDERGKTWSVKADRFGRVTRTRDPLQYEVTIERDTNGQPVRVVQPDPDGSGPLGTLIYITGYNDRGSKVFEKHPDGYTEEWTYSEDFQLVTSHTDAIGRTEFFSYDPLGNLIQETDAAGNSWTMTYNSRGSLLTRTTPDPDGAGPLLPLTTSYAYDAYERLVQTTFPDGTTQQFAYDAADNIISRTDEAGHTASFEFDALGRLVRTVDREGAVVQYVFDAAGQLVRTLDPLGNATDIEYNARGWKTKEILPDPDGSGPLERPENTWGYDAAGNIISEGIPAWSAGYQLTHDYDDAGRRIATHRTIAGIHIYYALDALGRIVQVTDPLNRVTKYQRNWRGQITEVELHDPDGSGPGRGPMHQWGYDPAGQLGWYIDPRGARYDVVHDSRGLVKTVFLPDPDGPGPQWRPWRTAERDALGRITAERDQLGRTYSFVYDARDRLIQEIYPDPDGSGPLQAPQWTYQYTVTGWKSAEIKPTGARTDYTYDREGRVVSRLDPDPDGAGPLSQPQWQFAYDARGLLVSQTDPRGGITTNEYDALGRLVRTTQPDPDGAGPLTAPVTQYIYGAQGRVVQMIDPEGGQWQYGYDGVGRLISQTDPLNHTTNFEYDAVGNRTRMVRPDPDGSGPLGRPDTRWVYDDYDRVVQIIDALSGTTYLSYDKANNLISLTDPVGNTTNFAYDNMNRLVMETNALGQSRSMYYNAGEELTRRVDRLGRAIVWDYDELGRPAAEQWYDDATPVPSLSITTLQEGGPVSEVQRVGYTAMMLMGGTFRLTFQGQTTADLSYMASAAEVQSALENLSNIGQGNVLVTKLQSGPSTHEWRLEFIGSLAGTNVAQVTIDTSTLYAWGGITPIEITDTDGGGTRNEIQQVELHNAQGGTFRLAFQGQATGILSATASAWDVETALEALADIDNVIVTGDAGGPWTVEFVGAQAGTNVARLDGDAARLTSGTLAREISYSWDIGTRLVAASDPDSSYTLAYDDLDRLVSIDNQGTPNIPRVVLNSSYDASGNRTRLAAVIDGTDDFVNDYTYDLLNRMTRVDQYGVAGGHAVAEKRVDMAYNSLGQFTEIVRYRALSGTPSDEVATSVYTYDAAHRLVGLSHNRGGQPLFTPYSWTYDPLDRIIEMVNSDGTSVFTYDQTDQLTGADHSYQTDEAYQYDANGNRTGGGYVTGSNNQLLEDGTYRYEYDAEGNRTAKETIATGEREEYTWDHRNRLVRFLRKDAQGAIILDVHYSYDVFDRRIGKTVDPDGDGPQQPTFTWFVYDNPSVVTGAADPALVGADHIVLEFTGSQPATLRYRYLHGPVVDQVFAREDVESLWQPGEVLWALGDHLGTVRDLIDSSGNVVNHLRYESFGRITSETNAAVDFLFAFTGRERDEESGLFYYRARYYDPAVGRFISEDPLGFAAGDPNLNRYAANLPLTRVDKSGREGREFDTRLKDVKGILEWFPDQKRGEFKLILKRGRYSEELVRFSIWLDEKGNLLHGTPVFSHGGRKLPGIGGSKIGKIATDLDNFVEIIVGKIAPGIKNIVITIGKEAGKDAATETVEVTVGKIGAPLWKRIFGAAAGAFFGAIADVLINPNTAYAAEPPRPIFREVNPNDIGLTDEDVIAIVDLWQEYNQLVDSEQRNP
ncbi:MAG: hypothetical protein KatS3mg110_4423 [Pirellulaceae bacterium]|nr:MAG: hypothetical protein KatS3mg110_4423 [Pirellulaceae bacterium]